MMPAASFDFSKTLFSFPNGKRADGHLSKLPLFNRQKIYQGDCQGGCDDRNAFSCNGCGMNT